MTERDIALIDDLLAQANENSLLEFKKDNTDPKVIAKLCSALANAARIDNQETAYVLWGIEDGSRKIIGSNFDPESTKGESNTVLQLWLAQRLKPSIAFAFRVVNHPLGRLVLLEIPAATTAPVAYEDIAYVRIGSATPKLSDYPDRQQKLITNLRPYVWEKGSAKNYLSADEVLSLLDYPGYFRLTQQNLPDNKAGILERLAADSLIQGDVGERWNISNLGAILFAHDLSQFDSDIARKAVRFIAYKGKNRATPVTHRQDGQKGYAVGFEGLLGFINGLLPSNEHIGEALRQARPVYPEIAIREVVANALIHQNMTIQGAGPQIELFEDRIEITNPGEPLVQTDRMIDLPPRSRNPMLGSLMRRMGICEEQGSGLDKVIASIELYQLPPPMFKAEAESMQVTLYSPRTFAEMTPEERVRACYQHAVLLWLSGQKLKNTGLCERLGIEKSNAPQATKVLNAALKAGVIKPAEEGRPRAGYQPWWA
ncbi:MAG: helix-turn-helix domain-containing protein [Candidatus Pelagadaptatus aseana]|uniref:ATP-binding protein n=1 Tax=Candidatus Pelagadaptatus aseana TaxID=3120508 RepID=UPI0039B274A4